MSSTRDGFWPASKPVVTERDNQFYVFNSDKPIILKETTPDTEPEKQSNMIHEDDDVSMPSETELSPPSNQLFGEIGLNKLSEVRNLSTPKNKRMLSEIDVNTPSEITSQNLSPESNSSSNLQTKMNKTRLMCISLSSSPASLFPSTPMNFNKFKKLNVVTASDSSPSSPEDGLSVTAYDDNPTDNGSPPMTKSAVTDWKNLGAPPILTQELRKLGFQRIPTTEEASLELRTIYSTPILTTAESFACWCDKAFPPYQKHRQVITESPPPKNSRKRAAPTVLAGPSKKRTKQQIQATPKNSTDEAKHELQTNPSNSTDEVKPKSHATSDESTDEVKEESHGFRTLAEAYEFAIAKEFVPDCYTDSQYTNSYKRAYSRVTYPLKSAWESLVSSTVSEKQARAIATQNGKDAIKKIGGNGAVMVLGIQADKEKAAKINLTLQEYINLPIGARLKTKETPHPYTDDQWDASYMRARNAIRVPMAKNLDGLNTEGMTQDEIKKAASERATKAMENLGKDAITARALHDDLDKAQDAGLTLEKWLEKWSEDLEKQRRKSAVKRSAKAEAENQGV